MPRPEPLPEPRPEENAARQELRIWVSYNVEPVLQAPLSRLIAAYVAESVRQDRAERERAPRAHSQYPKGQTKGPKRGAIMEMLDELFGHRD